MSHYFCWVFLLIASWPQTSQHNVGTKVVWRYASGGTAGGAITIYIMGDRRRTEYRNTSLHRDALTATLKPADPPANVVIQRCDLGRSFDLNTHTQEYASKEYPPTAEELKKQYMEPDWDTSELPAVRVETITVDTGEREEIFGQVARHVTVTTRTTSLPDAKNDPSVFVRDGWFIDFDRRISCEPREAPRTHDFSYFGAGDHWIAMQKIENVVVGNREEGLLVKKGQNNLSTTIQGTNGVNLNNESDVTEFYKGQLDPALFEVPSDFKLVGKIGW
jgi:hypothetical protein